MRRLEVLNEADAAAQRAAPQVKQRVRRRQPLRLKERELHVANHLPVTT